MNSYIMRATFASLPQVRIEADMAVADVVHLHPSTHRLFTACGIDSASRLTLEEIADRHVLQLPELLRAVTRAAGDGQ